ncbi:TPA: hypothetical protein ACH3X1_009194 [Trebouxia sp. C0004]
MIFASNGLRVSIDAAIDVLAQQQRLQLQRTMLLLNYRQKACEICSAILLLQSTSLYIASLSKKNRDRLVGQQAGLLKLPRRSLSKLYIIPRKTRWYEDVLMKLLEPHSFKYELRCSREKPLMR